jgi:hypothetical protein
MTDEITFFHSDSIERLTLSAIEREANARGFRTRFCDDLRAPAQIGVYCSHRVDPRNARFSAIMLHDLGQRHDVWPNFWFYEPWTRFDVGFVPGQTWSDRFLTNKRLHRWLAPKHGIYEVGWPKSDPIFDAQGPFQQELRALRTSLGLSEAKKTILYAPSWENDNKQDEFVAAALELDCNVLIKQADWPLSTHAHIAKNIDDMEAKYAGHARVKTMDRKTSIMCALAVADVIVSDESSVMVEALLFGVPAVAVTDWTIPDRDPPRCSEVPFDFVLKTTKAELTGALRGVLSGGHSVSYRGRRVSLQEYSDLWFSRRGGAAPMIMDILQACLAGRRPEAANVCERDGFDGSDQDPLGELASRTKAEALCVVRGGDWPSRIERKLTRLMRAR